MISSPDLSLAAVPPGLISPGLHPGVESLVFRRGGSSRKIRILQVHPGNGSWLELLGSVAQADFELYGIEPNPALFEQAQGRLKTAVLFCRSPLQQTFSRAFFDLIYIDASLPGQNLAVLLQRMRTFLVQGGGLLLNYHDPVDFTDWRLYSWFPELKSVNPPPLFPEVVRSLEENDFSLVWTGAHPCPLSREVSVELPQRMRNHLRVCGLDPESAAFKPGFDLLQQALAMADPEPPMRVSAGLCYREVFSHAGPVSVANGT